MSRHAVPRDDKVTTRQLLEQFDARPDDERSELLAELACRVAVAAHRVAVAAHDAPADDDLIAAADRLLTELDRHEQFP